MAVADQVLTEARRSVASPDAFVAALDETKLARIVAVDARTLINPFRPDRAQVVADLTARASELGPVADAVVASAAAARWSALLDLGQQRWVAFDNEPPDVGRFVAPDAPFPALATKPLGGLWTSTALPGTASAWLWSELNQGRTPVGAWRPVYADEVTVLEIDGLSAWIELCAIHGQDATATYEHHLVGSGFAFSAPFYAPNWNAVARDFDAVHLTWTGLLDTFGRVEPCGNGSCGLFGWEVESTLWLRWPFVGWEPA